MRPSLKPALRRVWRDPVTLQIGLDPERAVILSGLDEPVARFVTSLDGTRERAAVIESAPELGLDRGTAAELLDLLGAEGVLDDAATDTRQLSALRADERERLRPDLDSLSLLHKLTDAGMQAFARRRAAVIHVHGAGRVGAPLASLLAAAGIGKVSVSDAALTRHTDLAPGGLAADDVGARRE
ncbi:MAG: ThiF family adenylyltransferase, partial [Carbonactinosporaceae bacterium]